MFPLFFLFLHLSCFLYPQSASSQFVATLPISLMQCSTIANVRCGGSQGCCSAGGCCGAGCCGLMDICINQNSRPVCCSLGDPTRCGTKRQNVTYYLFRSFNNIMMFVCAILTQRLLQAGSSTPSELWWWIRSWTICRNSAKSAHAM